MCVSGATLTLAGNFNGYIDVTLGDNDVIDGTGSTILKPYVARYYNCQLNSSSISTESCESYHWDLNNTNYSASGTYSHMLQTAQGCDSVVNLILTIHNGNLQTTTVNACDNYLWSQTGENLTESGVYRDTLTNTHGCDSIVAINLTIVSDTVIIEVELSLIHI